MTTVSNEFFVGVDPSLSATGIVVIDYEGKLVTSRQLKNKLSGVKRLVYIRNEIHRLLTHYTSDGKVIRNIGIEGYSRGSLNRREEAGELGGVLRVLFYELAIPYIEVAPTQLKKYALGRGDGMKQHILLATYKKWGIEFKNDDEADAFVIAQIARAVHLWRIGEPLNMRKYELEVVKKLVKEKE